MSKKYTFKANRFTGNGSGLYLCLDITILDDIFKIDCINECIALSFPKIGKGEYTIADVSEVKKSSCLILSVIDILRASLANIFGIVLPILIIFSTENHRTITNMTYLIILILIFDFLSYYFLKSKCLIIKFTNSKKISIPISGSILSKATHCDKKEIDDFINKILPDKKINNVKITR